MKSISWVLVLCSAAYASPCPSAQARDESALVQIEQTWARALEQREAATLACILAEEFEDAGPDGRLTDRATTLAKAAVHPPLHHELSELHARVNGDAAYIRGLAKAVDASGNAVFTVRFTDIYAYRDGRWQCVAAQESMVAAARH